MNIVNDVNTHGSVYLFACAVLEHPRNVPNNLNCVVVDALVASTVPEHPPVICSLRYNTENEDDVFVHGTYRIFATVPFFRTILKLCSHSTFPGRRVCE
jgi:hypothetical protein